MLYPLKKYTRGPVTVCDVDEAVPGPIGVTGCPLPPQPAMAHTSRRAGQKELLLSTFDHFTRRRYGIVCLMGLGGGIFPLLSTSFRRRRPHSAGSQLSTTGSPSESNATANWIGRQQTGQSSTNRWRRLPLGSTATKFGSKQLGHV